MLVLAHKLSRRILFTNRSVFMNTTGGEDFKLPASQEKLERFDTVNMALVSDPTNPELLKEQKTLAQELGIVEA